MMIFFVYPPQLLQPIEKFTSSMKAVAFLDKKGDFGFVSENECAALKSMS